ncbi:C4-dicarboxylate ABC transporter substrate-binding protein [Hahella sp. KA22]|uniref:TRAP transporter substrate-binding protein n=1 Tax=Hahella sp. KA22 TaxID=1628392 RepID=UPI000FDD31FB|nr:TRAP transporter substrate-binding protein [Hahella sp. KA22]AZZ94848.1 C4-dicarboxylate ABC transporter substrate-binding protein [Hahella sp. KA22]QAY58221.1 C4-dicarboxylate ABC transporter substrate-binding protein [Hahella sp. KA22]
MRIRRLCLSFLLSLSASTGFAATKWDMPTPYADGTHHTQNIREFAADIEKATGGDLKIVVHSGASLFKHPEIFRAVRTGQAPIGEVFMGLLGNDDPIYKVDNIPFLVTSFDGAKKLYDASRPHIEKKLEKQGLKLLFSVPWPPQGIYTKDKLGAIDDLKGLKMRAYSPSTSRLSVLLGATPTTVQTPEIPQAFSTGIIDAMVTSPTTGVSSQAWDFSRYYMDSRAWIPKNMVFVNLRSFKRLSKEQQDAVLQAAKVAEERGWKMAEQETTEKTADLAKHGMNVTEPTQAFISEFSKVGQTMAKEWQDEVGAEGVEIVKGLNGG